MDTFFDLITDLLRLAFGAIGLGGLVYCYFKARLREWKSAGKGLAIFVAGTVISLALAYQLDFNPLITTGDEIFFP